MTSPHTRPRVRHRVDSVRSEWMAAEDSPDRKPPTSQCPVPGDRDPGILGTRRRVSARRRKERRHGLLVQSDHDHDWVLHRSMSGILRMTQPTRSAYDAAYASGRARTRMSAFLSRRARAGNILIRTISRSCRFNRFRATADRPCRGTMIPALEISESDSERKISTGPLRSRRPRRRMARISSVRRRRTRRGNPARMCSRVSRASPGLSAPLVVRFIAHRERVTTLLAATRQHFAPGLRFHPGTESMIAESLAPTRVSVCRLHLSTAPVFPVRSRCRNYRKTAPKHKCGIYLCQTLESGRTRDDRVFVDSPMQRFYYGRPRITFHV